MERLGRISHDLAIALGRECPIQARPPRLFDHLWLMAVTRQSVEDDLVRSAREISTDDFDDRR